MGLTELQRTNPGDTSPSSLPLILINKMDDPTVKWSKERYDYCKDQLTPYLKRVGFNPAKDIHFLPCSGLNGSGIKNPVGSDFPSYT